MQSFDLKKYLPHILIIAGFAIFSLIYCYPVLQGKQLAQGDFMSWMGMSHEATTYHEKTGEDVLWSNSMFGGMPTYTYVIYAGHNYVIKVQQAVEMLSKPAYLLFIAMLSFYLLMLVLKVDKWLGAIGAFAYTFATFNIILIVAGHDTELLALCYLPAVMAGLFSIYSGKYLSGAALLGISLSLMIMTGHFQVLYYFIIMVLFAVIGLFVAALKEGRIRSFIIASVISLVVSCIAAGSYMSRVLSTNEYGKETMRGGKSELTFNHDQNKKSGGLDKEYAFRWSNEAMETFVGIVPGLYGGSNGEKVGSKSNTYDELIKLGVNDDQASQFCEQLPMYWGKQPIMSGPVYFGAIICFLFVLALMVIKSPHKWWMVSVICLAILMSLGYNFPAFNYFLFDHLPGLNKFRTPTMILVLPQFLLPVMGIWVLNDIVSGKIAGDELWKKVKTAAIITAGLCLLLAIGGRMFFDFKNDAGDARMAQQYGQMMGNAEAGNKIVAAIREDRATMATTSGLTSAIFIIAAAALFWAFSKKKINTTVLIAGIGLLIAVDLLKQDVRYLNESKYQEAIDFDSNFHPRKVDEAILRDPDPYYRVLDLTKDTYNDAIQAYFHKCIGGYHPAKMEIYQDMIDVHMNQATGKFNTQVLNMLNMKYLIFPGPNREEAYQSNPDACGNAWFVNEVKWVNTADDEILSLKGSMLGDTTKVASAWSPKQTAVMRNTFKDKVQGAISKDSAATVKLAKYGLNHISYTSVNNQDGLAVFSDIWYPHGWKAFIDGNETPILRANYILRALNIPKGNHKIEFVFHPESFYGSDTVGIICSIIIFGLCIVAIYWGFKKPVVPADKNA